MVTHAIRRAFVPIIILMIAVVGSTVIWAQAPVLPAAAVAAAAADGAPGGGIAAVNGLHLLVGRSTILDVGAPIARVSLTSPDIADALVTTPTQLLINGKTPGTISLFVWDRAGDVRRYEVVVQRDLMRLSAQFRELFPGEDIKVEPNGKNLVLSGKVSNKDAIDKAVNLAAGYVEKKDEVVSLLQVRPDAPSNQVLLHVRFAEVSRNALTELGSSFFTGANGYKNVLGRTTTEQYAAPIFDNKGPNGSSELVFSDYLNVFLFDMKHQLGTVIKALQTKGLFQSLAEPNLVAESGKEASFLAGGEIPVPIAQPGGGGVAVTIQYKEFGIRLNFTPTVEGDRVHLKVRPEVSSLDFANGVVLQGFRIPALSTRRAETELELNNGQTFAIAGLLNNTVSSTMQKIPGIGDIPILGLLFRSKSAQKDRTELVVMITPEILPNNSHGVTGELPRTQERYLTPLPPKKSYEPPPPAFQNQGGSAQGAVRRSPEPAVASPSSAAAAVSALTPGAPQIVQPADVPAAQETPAKVDTNGTVVATDDARGAAQRQSSTERGAASTSPASSPAASPAPDAQPSSPAQATQTASAPDAQASSPEPAVQSRPLTKEEQKRIERARKLEAKQAEEERKKAEKEKERQDKLAREQAKRDAKAAREQAKRDAEAAKQAQEQAQKDAQKQAELDREQQKELKAAAERLQAAQAAYEAELAKSKSDKNKEKKP
jgi:pilus assembly protein CpaC